MIFCVLGSAVQCLWVLAFNVHFCMITTFVFALELAGYGMFFMGF